MNIYKLIYGLGLTYLYFTFDWGYEQHDIRGAVIKGVVYGDTTFIISSVENPNDQPDKFALYQNYPNPFNPKTIISYELAKRTDVTIKIFDLSGREIMTLLDKPQSAGKNSIEFNGSHLASGLYFYRIETSRFNQTRKMLLLK